MARCCPSLLPGVIWMTFSLLHKNSTIFAKGCITSYLKSTERFQRAPNWTWNCYFLSGFSIWYLPPSNHRPQAGVQQYSALSWVPQLASQGTLQSLTKPSAVSTHSPCCKHHLHTGLCNSLKSKGKFCPAEAVKGGWGVLQAWFILQVWQKHPEDAWGSPVLLLPGVSQALTLWIISS